MSFSAVDEVKERIRQMTDLVELIGEQIPLRRQGRMYAGLCPWHQDSRPSLQVDPERQTWKCWVCNLSGDCYEFVMRREGMTFPEAKRLLADRAGISVSNEPTGRRTVPGSPDDKNTLYEAMAWAVRQYHEYLLRAPEAEVARTYLHRRQITPESIERFQIGFSPPDWDWLLQRSASTSISREVLEAAGLVATSERTGGFYDIFRGRVMFPIFDPQRRPIGFGGRRLEELTGSDDRSAKYINSRETRLFSKSEQLYGLHLAKDAILRQRHALMMEGYTDVVVAHQLGIENVVAILGTAIVSGHIHLLRRFADRVTLVLDGDAAGRKRANEVLEVFLANQLDLRVVTLPDGQDPCDFLLKRGVSSMEALVEQAPDALEHQISVETLGLDLVQDTQQAHVALEKLLSTLAGAPRPTVGDTSSARLIWEQQILNRLSRIFRVDEESLRTRLRELRHHKRPVATRPPNEFSSEEPADVALNSIERELFELILQLPLDAVLQVLEEIEEQQLPTPAGRTLYRAVRQCVDEDLPPDFHQLMCFFEEPAFRHLLVDLDTAAQEKSGSDAQLALQDLLHAFADQRIGVELQRCLSKLEHGDLDEAEQVALLQKTVELRRQQEHE